MKKVKITAIRKIQYDDLMAKYENPIEHTCDVSEGQSWVSEGCQHCYMYFLDGKRGIDTSKVYRTENYTTTQTLR